MKLLREIKGFIDTEFSLNRMGTSFKVLIVEIKSNKLINKFKGLVIEYSKKTFEIIKKKKEIGAIEISHLENKGVVDNQQPIFHDNANRYFRAAHTFINSFLFRIRNTPQLAIDILFYMHAYKKTMKAKYKNLIHNFIEFFYIDLSNPQHLHINFTNFIIQYIEVM